MTTHELQNIVLLESLAMALILLLIISAFKRWKKIIWIAGAGATIAIFTAWSPVMATGTVMVYAPAITLLWFEQEYKSLPQYENKKKHIRTACWAFLAIGVCTLIVKNIYNIYTYLQ